MQNIKTSLKNFVLISNMRFVDDHCNDKKYFFGGITLNIVITSDSTTDLSNELKQRYNITTLPLSITLGDKTFVDGVDITPDDIYAHHAKTGELPKTSAANLGDFIDFFKPFAEQGKNVIHFSLSSESHSACLERFSSAETSFPETAAFARSESSFLSLLGSTARPITSIRPMFSFLM